MQAGLVRAGDKDRQVEQIYGIANMAAQEIGARHILVLVDGDDRGVEGLRS